MSRTMRCPFCGHESVTTRDVGAMFCGPHGYGRATTPAVQMREVEARPPEAGSNNGD